MELIIDITENHLKTLQKMNECGLGYYHRAILNGTPLSEELEKLKTEIKQQGSIHIKYRRTENIDHLVDSIVYQCKDGFCNYIDNHIAELKDKNINEKG